MKDFFHDYCMKCSNYYWDSGVGWASGSPGFHCRRLVNMQQLKEPFRCPKFNMGWLTSWWYDRKERKLRRRN